MFAIINFCGTQYKVKAGFTVDFDYLSKENEEEFVIENVSLIGLENGEFEHGSNYVVKCKVVNSDIVGDKIRVFKKRRRKHYRKSMGFKPHYTRVLVQEIVKNISSAKKVNKDI